MKSNLDFHTDNLPLCILGVYGANAYHLRSENQFLNLEDVPHGTVVDNSSVKFEKCKKCALESKCLGVWKTYYQKYGEEEFNAM